MNGAGLSYAYLKKNVTYLPFFLYIIVEAGLRRYAETNIKNKYLI